MNSKDRGKGSGASYQPYLTVRDVPSKGFSHRITGWKTGRVHHFLSNLELKFFFLLEWSLHVRDIREQFPLPLNETLDIAGRLGIRHPADPKTGKAVVMTSDFVIDIAQQENLRTVVRSVKPKDQLGRRRTIEKLEIERTYWSEANYEWAIITEDEIPDVLVKNVEAVHFFWNKENLSHLSISLMSEIAEALSVAIRENESQPLAKLGVKVDKTLGLDLGSSLSVVKHLIAQRKWTVDMHKPLNFSAPMDFLGMR